MIAAFSEHGFVEYAFLLYRRLVFEENLAFDRRTLVAVLYTCSTYQSLKRGKEVHGHIIRIGLEKDISIGGALVNMNSKCTLLDSAIQIFYLMPQKDQVARTSLLCKAGKLNEAKELIDSKAMKADAYIWGTLLAACKLHGNVDLGKLAASYVLVQDPNDDGAYVSLSNIYADLDEWEEVDKIRKLMKGSGVRKEVGISFA